jgi:hypothetical protein
MKKIFQFISVISFYFLALSVNGQNDLHVQPADSMGTFQTFKKEAQEELKDNEKRIERLRDKTLAKTDEVKAYVNVQIDSLEQRNRRLKADLANYRENVKTDWREFRKKFEHDMDELKQSFEELKDQ